MIRTLHDQDAEAYFQLRREMLTRSPLSFGSSVADDRASSAEAVRAMLARAPEAVVIGAFVDQELVGAVGVVREGQLKARHKAVIWGMYVSSGHRGNGIASQLIQSALEHARSLPGVSCVHLSVTEAAADARHVYERAGFSIWGTEPDALRHEGASVAEHHMVLQFG